MSDSKEILTNEKNIEIWKQNISFLRSKNNRHFVFFIFFVIGFISFSLLVDQRTAANIVFAVTAFVYLTGWFMLTCNLKKKKDFYTPYLSIYTLLVILWLIIMILLDWLLFDVSLFYRILFTLCCILSIIMEASFYVFYKRTTSPWPKKVLITSVCILAIDSLLVIILLCQRFLYAVALTPIGLIHLMHFLILTARIKPINKR